MGPIGYPELVIIGLIGLFFLSIAFWIWMLVDCISNEPTEGNDKMTWVIVILGLNPGTRPSFPSMKKSRPVASVTPVSIFSFRKFSEMGSPAIAIMVSTISSNPSIVPKYFRIFRLQWSNGLLCFFCVVDASFMIVALLIVS